MKKLLALMMCLMISLSVTGAAFAEGPTEDPYGRYEQTITYTTGYVLTDQGADTLKGTPYEKDTPTDNAYTRYILAVLNVQNENLFEATPGDSYDQKVSLAIASRTIPDIMFIEDYSILAELVEEDMVEDLTAVYNAYACDTVRASYASYGDNNPLNTVTFDGKIMAIPKTQLSDAQSFLWLREDWLDKLNLEIPHTAEEVAAVLKAFVEQDPNGTGAADTIGLPVLNTIYGGYPNNHFAIDNFFTAFNAYPNIWIRNEEGEVVYGSVQPEMKDALALLRDWYAQGLIDKEFTTRTYDDIVAMIASGRCGAYVGPWWSPFNPAQTSSYANNGAEWINVTAPVGSEGKINGINTKPYAGFVVVRKGYDHPEIAMKIVNVISEYSKLDTSDAVKEVKDNQSIAYFNWPLYCQVQRGDNAQLMSQHVKAVLDGEADVSTLTTEEASYYESAVNFLAAEAEGKKAQSADYSQYMSRMVAIYRIIDEPANFMTPAFFETTEMMAMRWASLEKMELETVLKIIVGDNDLSSFDSFVSNWERSGGNMITDEVREAVGD